MHTVSAFTHRDPSLLAGPAIHSDVQLFLFREALLLDHERYDEWIALLAPDIRYRTPARFARAIGIDPPLEAPFFEDDYQSLISRIRELRKSKLVPSTSSSQAAAQTRRLITNVIVSPRNCGEYDVLSYLLITRADPSDNSSWIVTAERYDHLRCAAHSFKICRREIVVDQRAAAGAVEVFL